jgi:hypothetical protein
LTPRKETGTFRLEEDEADGAWADSFDSGGGGKVASEREGKSSFLTSPYETDIPTESE